MHASGEELHLWSIKYHESGIFDLWREAIYKVTPNFGDRSDALPSLIEFWWNTIAISDSGQTKVAQLIDLNTHHYRKYWNKPLRCHEINKE